MIVDNLDFRLDDLVDDFVVADDDVPPGDNRSLTDLTPNFLLSLSFSFCNFTINF